MNKKATKEDWKNLLPMDNPKRIVISLHFTAKQYEKLQFGYIPCDMGEKWFVYFENEWLYFHRSWTGLLIYKAQIFKEKNDYVINDFFVERNAEKYANLHDIVDIDNFANVIASGLLDVDVNEIFKNKSKNMSNTHFQIWSSMVDSNLASFKKIDIAKIKSVLFGVAVGDALGVPVEFTSRKILLKTPVSDMIGYGTYNLPAGTWSDDSSLTFCLAEALANEECNLQTIADNFVKWAYEGFWAPYGKVFDIGITTSQSLQKIKSGTDPKLAGGNGESENGNGSLMRILPLLFHLIGKSQVVRYELVTQVSSITHRHIRSVLSCFYYIEFAYKIFLGADKFKAYHDLKIEFLSFLTSMQIEEKEIAKFDRLLRDKDINDLADYEIFSSGYVIHSLEASIWCLLTTNNYHDAVLKAVNLGEDTDTTAAITGGLAGLLYGYENIPQLWLDHIARKNDIEDLSERLGKKLIES